MNEIEQGFPTPVRVVYPDGQEEIGHALGEETLRVGDIGRLVELDDLLWIDGVPRRVVGQRKEKADSERSEVRVILTHEPIE